LSRSGYAANGIALVAGDPVVAIDRLGKTVTTRGGVTEGYDRLLIATGSTVSSSRDRSRSTIFRRAATPPG
jgi:NAD(P)H-nitrite reductase large subunit